MGNFISEARMIFQEELRNTIEEKIFRLNGGDPLSLYILRSLGNVKKQGGENTNLKKVMIF